jgi:hypothetical protein
MTWRPWLCLPLFFGSALACSPGLAQDGASFRDGVSGEAIRIDVARNRAFYSDSDLGFSRCEIEGVLVCYVGYPTIILPRSLGTEIFEYGGETYTVNVSAASGDEAGALCEAHTFYSTVTHGSQRYIYKWTRDSGLLEMVLLHEGANGTDMFEAYYLERGRFGSNLESIC